MTIDLGQPVPIGVVLTSEVLAWVREHLHFNGVDYVFADGVSFEDVRLAIQAAWLADNNVVAAVIAERYKIVGVLCLACTQRPPRRLDVMHAMGETKKKGGETGNLCEPCATAIIMDYVRSKS